jgi:iron complex transport system ATP-binding protein
LGVKQEVGQRAAEALGIVQVRDVTYAVDGTRILDRVDLEVRPGEVLAVVGPNGAGKSTLLALLAGDVEPTSGRVIWADGRPLGQVPLSELARVRGVVLQDQAVAFAFQVAQIVRMGREPWRGTQAEADDNAAIARALHATQVEHLVSRRYPTLSGGEKGRVAMARVLAQTPTLYLLDEPTAALDINHQERVLTELRSLVAAGKAVVVVLHDLSVAAAYADRVALFDTGRLVGIGPPARVFTGELLTQVYRHPVEVLAHPRTGGLLVMPVRDAARTQVGQGPAPAEGIGVGTAAFRCPAGAAVNERSSSGVAQ